MRWWQFSSYVSWTLTAEIERRIQALETRCYRRLLNISYKDHVTNEGVRNRIQNAIGVHDDLLTMVKKQKLRWYGHNSRSSGMAKTTLQGTVKGARRRGRKKKRWEDNQGMNRNGVEGSGRQGWVERYCCNVICGDPTTSEVKGLRWDVMKLILQTRMRSRPVMVDVWCLVGPFVYFHTSCVRTAKALARLRRCASSPEPTIISLSWLSY